MRRLPQAARVRLWSLLVLAGLALLAPSVLGAEQGGAVRVLPLDGQINPISARYLIRAIEEAEEENAELVLIELDTPGGLLDATQELTAAMIGAEVPIAVYVTPSGARAASAGTFITMAAHVAAMAPGTRIGAATPVAGGGEDIDDDLRRKIINDTVVYARNIAEARGRNADWAEEAIREAAVIDAETAEEIDVIDLVAESRAALLDRIDGWTVELAGGEEVVLQTADAPVVVRPMSAFESLFMALADPTIAVLLLSLGALGIYFELANPGLFVPGIAGAIFVLLAFLGLGTLPLSLGGLALLVLGLALLGAEIFVASGGLLGIGGVIAFGLGAFLLIDDTEAPFVEVSRPVIVALTLGMGLFVLVAIRGMGQVRGRPAAIGPDDVVGLAGHMRGKEVFVGGERWSARRPDPRDPLPPTGTPVRVVSRDGLTLVVEPGPDPEDTHVPPGTAPDPGA